MIAWAASAIPMVAIVLAVWADTCDKAAGRGAAGTNGTNWGDKVTVWVAHDPASA
jgi:hypothetical protein